MAVRIQFRRDTAANWTSVNPVLGIGEPGIETDTTLMKVGDGTTAWNSLPYTHNGTVTSVGVVSANGFAGSSSGGTTPNITLTTTVTGILKGNGTAVSAASAGDFPTLNQNTTGNAATATALQTARTIGGVSFDGTANITVASATGGFAVSGGNLSLGSNSLTMTGSIGATGARVLKGWFTDLEVTNTISGSVSGNAGTATALQNARTIGGVSFDGTANITVASATSGFTISGGDLALGANNLTMTGSIGATGARVTKGWFTDLEVTNGIVGDISGNAATATALQTARNIGGVSFNGTADITVATATGGFTVSGGNLALGVNSLTLTGSIGATGARVTKGWFTDLEATNTIVGSVNGNAATATALQTARTIGGVSFDGTVNITVASATGGFTVSGGNLALGTNSLTLTGSIGSTGSRVTKGWFTDLEVTNAIAGSITGNAATVTTNANLTGPITSVGNATSIASQTGTGTKFVMDTAPTIVTPTIAKIANLTTNGFMRTSGGDGTLGSSALVLSDITTGTDKQIVYGSSGTGVTQSANFLFDSSVNKVTIGATGTTNTGAGLLIQERALQVTGRIDENTTSLIAQLGIGPAGDSPRFLLGSPSGNWQIDNFSGSMRFFLPSNVRMTLTSTQLQLGNTALVFSAGNIQTDTTTGTKIGTATTQKFGFYNATPIVQPGATTDLGTVLSNLGLRASGTAYPITTSGAVALSGTVNLAGATISNTGTLTLPTSTDTLVGRATTDTLTNKRITRRVLATAGPGAIPTYNTDNYDVLHFTALATAITSMSSGASGTPLDGDVLRISFTDNGTARAITWGANFEASGTQALPTTTVNSTRLDVIFVWNTETSKWRCMSAS